MDEPPVGLTAPATASPPIAAFQYSFGSNPVATLVTANPLLCGNTAAASGSTPVGIRPLYYSANASTAAVPPPFVFGATAAAPTVSAIAYGATNLVYDGSQVQFGGDPLDALVCYGLTTSDGVNFVHKVSRDLFDSDFEVPGTSGILGNSTVALNVIQLPTAANGNYYIYTVDVDIPPLPVGTNCNILDCNFALIEGYDTSVFDTTSGQWCVAPAGATSCVSPPPSGGTAAAFGDININYSNYGATVSLQAPIGGTQHKTVHFVAFRKLAANVSSLPASGAPVVMAALFSPLDLEENKLDDNVSTGNNTLANVAPSVATDNTFNAAVGALHENTDSGTLTFGISDPDSPESTGNLLHASVTLNLPNGIQVPVAADCGSATPITTLPVNRTCTIDIPLNNATFWDFSVATQYQGQFNNVATDNVNGTYASGVSAGVQIVATDAQGKNGAPVSTLVHIFSTKNDAPVVTTDANQLPPDSNNNNYPTWTCSIGTTNSCGTFALRYLISLTAASTVVPGPVAAFDELAAQTTAVVNYTGSDANGGNVQCTLENGSIFTTNGNPIVYPSDGSTTNYDLSFQLTNPPTYGSALCTATMTDAESGGFPNGETAATVQSTFRIVVNP
ncbi:MAG: hypothetical protein JSS28_04925 [Proteobacteria bacterium]|nr:hypothetical protein [Pseudomonadota bacterium]